MSCQYHHQSALDVLALEIADREIEVNTCFYTELDSIWLIRNI